MTDLVATVAVCTRNRSASLLSCLEATLEVDFPRPNWELVIVDNGSTDDTPELARSFASKHPEHVRVVEEPHIGLSYCRNRAIAEARGQILVFLDDDAYPEPRWLSALVEPFRDKACKAAGGPVRPRFEGAVPEWLDDRFLPYLTVWDLGPHPLELSYNEYPRGANMAFSREVFDEIGLFSSQLGRRGSRLRSCEETELCLRIERTGGKILYVPSAGVEHSVDASRISKDWFLLRFAAQGASEATIDWRHGGPQGLLRGSARFRRMAHPAGSGDDPPDRLMRRFQRASYHAYLRQACLCPFTVRRYRTSAAGGRLTPWSPPSA